MAAARQNGDAVPGLLAAPHGAVASLLNGGLREFPISGLELLQRDDVTGFSVRSQPIRLPSRLFTPLMLKVAIFIGRWDFAPALKRIGATQLSAERPSHCSDHSAICTMAATETALSVVQYWA
jgi:hypothetical protein